MLGLYYVVDDIQVTNPTDVLRKDLTLDLALFCFQWVATFWSITFALAIVVMLARRNTFWSNFSFTSILVSVLPLIAFAYYRNLVLLMAA